MKHGDVQRGSVRFAHRGVIRVLLLQACPQGHHHPEGNGVQRGVTGAGIAQIRL